MQGIKIYTIAVFIVVLIAGCAVNLIKKHYVIQLAGIAALFILSTFRLLFSLESLTVVEPDKLLEVLFPLLSGTAACLLSMVLGFWLFPSIRKRFRD